MSSVATPTTPSLPLTEARAQLFRLAEELLTGRAERVILTHRSHADDIVLLPAAALARLEEELAVLRARVAPALRPLRGLGRITAPDSDPLQALRAEAGTAFDAKLEGLAAPYEYPRASVRAIAAEPSPAPRGRRRP